MKYYLKTSFFSLHCILHQHVLYEKILKMDHVIDAGIKTVNFIRVGVLSHREFVALFQEAGKEYGEIFYHGNMR
jgi:hypothetical protein